MSNLDKDIEIEFVKEKIEECTRIIQSVSNMESKKAYSKERTNFKKVLNLIENKDKAIETWKKIAEFLADKGNFDHYSYCESNIFSCNAKTPKKTCKQCIIDWARKEVDK